MNKELMWIGGGLLLAWWFFGRAKPAAVNGGSGQTVSQSAMASADPVLSCTSNDLVLPFAAGAVQ